MTMKNNLINSWEEKQNLIQTLNETKELKAKYNKSISSFYHFRMRLLFIIIQTIYKLKMTPSQRMIQAYYNYNEIKTINRTQLMHEMLKRLESMRDSVNYMNSLETNKSAPLAEKCV